MEGIRSGPKPLREGRCQLDFGKCVAGENTTRDGGKYIGQNEDERIWLGKK